MGSKQTDRRSGAGRGLLDAAKDLLFAATNRERLRQITAGGFRTSTAPPQGHTTECLVALSFNSLAAGILEVWVEELAVEVGILLCPCHQICDSFCCGAAVSQGEVEFFPGDGAEVSTHGIAPLNWSGVSLYPLRTDGKSNVECGRWLPCTV